jgi:hypothetical protein
LAGFFVSAFCHSNPIRWHGSGLIQGRNNRFEMCGFLNGRWFNTANDFFSNANKEISNRNKGISSRKKEISSRKHLFSKLQMHFVVLQPYFCAQAGSHLREPVHTTAGSSARETVGRSSSVNNNILAYDFQLLPNPSNDLAYLRVNAGNALSLDITLFNLQGKAISNIYRGKTTDTLIPIDVHSLSSGVYFVAINTGERVQALKLLKL